MKLKFASLLSLWLLSCMLFVMIFLITVFVEMDWGLLLWISLTILINFLLWLISPTISDRIYKMFYKMNRISLEEVATRAPYAAAKIQEICEKYNIKMPFDVPVENCMIIPLTENGLSGVSGNVIYPSTFFE